MLHLRELVINRFTRRKTPKVQGVTYTGNQQLDLRLSFARGRAQIDGRIRFVTAQEISLRKPHNRFFFAMGPDNWAYVNDGKWERNSYKGES